MRTMIREIVVIFPATMKAPVAMFLHTVENNVTISSMTHQKGSSF